LKKLHNEELQSLYFACDIVTEITSKMGWTRHVAHMAEIKKIHINFWLKDLNGD
jgi:hypothetical protein